MKVNRGVCIGYVRLAVLYGIEVCDYVVGQQLSNQYTSTFMPWIITIGDAKASALVSP